jgi:hypothetical protein
MSRRDSTSVVIRVVASQARIDSGHLPVDQVVSNDAGGVVGYYKPGNMTHATFEASLVHEGADWESLRRSSAFRRALDLASHICSWLAS